MLKIDEQLRRKELPDYILEQLDYVDVFNIRSSIAIFIFLMMDLFMAIPLFFPFVPAYLYVLLPPLVLLNLWGIWIIVRDPFSVQQETLLIIALGGCFASPAYLIISHKLAYYYIGIHDWSYYVIVTLVYVLTTLWILHYRLSRFKDLSYETLMRWEKEERKPDREKNKKSGWLDVNKYMAIILYIPAIGYLIAQSMKHSETGAASVLIICFLSLAFVFSYTGIKFTHRLLVMKVNPQFVYLETPQKSVYIKEYVQGKRKIK